MGPKHSDVVSSFSRKMLLSCYNKMCPRPSINLDYLFYSPHLLLIQNQMKEHRQFSAEFLTTTNCLNLSAAKEDKTKLAKASEAIESWWATVKCKKRKADQEHLHSEGRFTPGNRVEFIPPYWEWNEGMVGPPTTPAYSPIGYASPTESWLPEKFRDSL